MPAGVLPFENRGLVTADQPWPGSYTVNAMIWAIAQITQVVSPPTAAGPGGWRYINSASGYLQGNRADGSCVTLPHGIPGIEVGGWYPAYFSNLTVTTP